MERKQNFDADTSISVVGLSPAKVNKKPLERRLIKNTNHLEIDISPRRRDDELTFADRVGRSAESRRYL